MSDFDWKENPAVVAHTAAGIAVYVNERNEVVVRQEDPLGEHDDCVAIPLHLITPVIAAIRKAAADAQ